MRIMEYYQQRKPGWVFPRRVDQGDGFRHPKPPNLPTISSFSSAFGRLTLKMTEKIKL